MSEDTDLIPTINHMIGQQEVVRRFRVALEASWNDGTRLPHMLLTGGPGLGKTMLAHLAAKEMGVELHERLAQVLTHPGTINGLLLSAEEKDIVFLDEVHELPPNVQTTLYRAMEGGGVTLRTRNDETVTMPVKDTTIIAATTDEFRLLTPLRDRFKLVLQFTEYDTESLSGIVEQRAQLHNIHLDEGVAREIAQRSKGTPRIAIRLLESCHRFARSQGEDAVSHDCFEQAMTLDGIDALGLDQNEQRYLRLLASKRDQPMRLFTVAAATRLHRRTVQEVVEPHLLQLGFVERTPNGRIITARGLEHVAQQQEAHSEAKEAS